MAISNCLFSHTSENLRRFSVWCVLAKLTAKPRNYSQPRQLYAIKPQNVKYLQILILLILFNSSYSQNLECGDLLEKYAKKLNKVEFIECKSGTGQTILEANYKVLGKDSKGIEEILITEFGIGKLKFACCGWESENGKNGYVHNKQLKAINQNYVLEISMFANAEKKNKKGETEIEFDRNKVDFNLKVRILEI